MGKKLYVGNLPYSATDEELSSRFSECGTVESSKVIIDRDTGRSKGFGFVEMPKPGEAKAAMKNINGKDVAGSKIRVKKAEAKPDQAAKGAPAQQTSKWPAR